MLGNVFFWVPLLHIVIKVRSLELAEDQNQCSNTSTVSPPQPDVRHGNFLFNYEGKYRNIYRDVAGSVPVHQNKVSLNFLGGGGSCLLFVKIPQDLQSRIK